MGSSGGLVRVALSDWPSLLVFLSVYQEDATYVSHHELGGESLFKLARGGGGVAAGLAFPGLVTVLSSSHDICSIL